MYFPLRNTCSPTFVVESAETLALELYSLAVRSEIAPGTDQVGAVHAISAETGGRVDPGPRGSMLRGVYLPVRGQLDSR